VKKEIDILDATPSKRLFLSIIADYDLNKSICELVDNGLDVWVRSGRASKITIKIALDKVQQTISVEDDAGGLPLTELSYIIGPGHTGNKPTDDTIGIFGVGTKRAVVALAQDIRVLSRYKKSKTHQVEFDDKWLEDEDWQLPVYEVDEIAPRTTTVQLQRLRIPVTDESIEYLRDHLSATYARFLTDSHVRIILNGTALTPHFFDDWSYPPKYLPRRYTGTLNTYVGRNVAVEAFAGLSSESSPAAGEYGVYFYCNGRLVARALKSFEVGFTKGLAGLPHPKVSLTKVIVSLTGDARSMPWNSSKSDISTKHEVFVALHPWLVQVVKDYAALSRIWMGDWPAKVFRYTSGQIEHVPIDDFPAVKKSFLPPMPKSRPRYGDVIAQKNQSIVKDKPWVKGLYEGVIATDLITKQRLDQKNRIALIVLDSTLEISFKDYLVNESGYHYSNKQLLDIFSARHKVHAEIKRYVTLSNAQWKKIDYYYAQRCKLVHERANSTVPDNEIVDFRSVVEKALSTMFNLKFSR
jgi:hypothetical protein